ncbi:nucleotidyltransferase domain-containing protein [Dyadobacter sp. 676]|uniref:Nucleotidyltransferase domain-containing protein n=1 Tax=Dyadobacter sp. 676 TaxID=3088362 RepID=A0AAU8FLL2_9BACT
MCCGPILACDWICTADTMAPTEFIKLLDSQVKDKAVRREIDNLLVRKSGGEELARGPRIPLLHDFLTEKLALYKEYAKQLPAMTMPDTDALNTLFRDTLAEVWNIKI